MPDRLRLAQHRTDLAAVVAAEVAAHPLAEVGRLAHVQHLVAVTAEQVHAGRARQVRGQLQLRRLRVPGQLGECHEIVEPEHAEPGGALEEEVEEIGRGERVVERPVGRAVVEAEPARQRAETAVGHLVAHEPAGERRGVDHGRCDRRPAVALECGPQEREVEPDVVADEHGVAEEVDERAEHGVDVRGGGDQASVSPVSTLIRGGIARPGLTSVWNVARHSPPRTLTTPISVIMSLLRSPPVVSRSSTQNVASASGTPRSSKLR